MKLSKLACGCLALFSVQLSFMANAQEEQPQNHEKKEQVAPIGNSNAERLEVANKVLAGEKLDEKTIEECHLKFLDDQEKMHAKYDEKPPRFNDEDNASFYCQAYLMSIIDHKRHGGWPHRYDGLNRSYAQLRKELEKQDDILMMATVIIPAVNHREVDYATEVFRKLHAKDPKWSLYVNEHIKKYVTGDPVFLKFSEIADEIMKAP